MFDYQLQYRNEQAHREHLNGACPAELTAIACEAYRIYAAAQANKHPLNGNTAKVEQGVVALKMLKETYGTDITDLLRHI